jgi:hypothetical protein
LRERRRTRLRMPKQIVMLCHCPECLEMLYQMKPVETPEANAPKPEANEKRFEKPEAPKPAKIESNPKRKLETS